MKCICCTIYNFKYICIHFEAIMGNDGSIHVDARLII